MAASSALALPDRELLFDPLLPGREVELPGLETLQPAWFDSDLASPALLKDCLSEGVVGRDAPACCWDAAEVGLNALGLPLPESFCDSAVPGLEVWVCDSFSCALRGRAISLLTSFPLPWEHALFGRPSCLLGGRSSSSSFSCCFFWKYKNNIHFNTVVYKWNLCYIHAIPHSISRLHSLLLAFSLPELCDRSVSASSEPRGGRL